MTVDDHHTARSCPAAQPGEQRGAPTPCVTPGRYLQLRRTAAGLTVEDVAARIGTEPPVAGQSRVEMLAAIESGEQPLTDDVARALRPVFAFDSVVLGALWAIAAGRDVAPPAICRHCGCSEWDACVLPGGRACSWSTIDCCTGCAGKAA